jgi:MEMO1 family protein
MKKTLTLMVALIGISVSGLVGYKKELEEYFDLASRHFPSFVSKKAIKALIVPHAGYYYSGLCAATAYNSIKNSSFERVILIGPSHLTSFNGIALPHYSEVTTKLGKVLVDVAACNVLKKEKFFKTFPPAHQGEHSIEVQYPFLQMVLNKFKIIPLIVGSTNNNMCKEIANSIKKIYDEKTLLVISADFTHYGPNYNYIPFKKDILSKIKLLDASNFNRDNQAKTSCGIHAIKILQNIIDLPCHLSLYYTSAQMENARVNGKIDISKLFAPISDEKIQNSVSYAGFIFSDPEEKPTLTAYERKVLLKLARNSISRKFGEPAEHPPIFCGLKTKTGAFVTLNTKDGNLRGCIGRIFSDEPLYQTVDKMAAAAAFEDNRFTPLSKKELDSVIIDITVLTTPKSIKNYNDIVVGRDGIVLTKGFYSAVFLPQVPISLKWNLKKTLEELSEKAGLDKNAYKVGSSFKVFQGFEFKEIL